MDTNQILLWIVGVGSVLPLLRLLRASHTGTSGWMAVLTFVLLLTAGAYLIVPEQAGYVGGIAWGLLLLVPSLGIRWLGRFVGNQQYGRARRLSRFLRVLHPLDGWTRYPELMGALEAGQRGDLASASGTLERLVATGSPALRRLAAFHLHRLRGDWSGFLKWIDTEYTDKDLLRDPSFFTAKLRALGETGALNHLLLLVEGHLSLLDQRALDMMRGLAYLCSFAFCGRKEAAARVLRLHLRMYGPEVRSFWLATAACAEGDTAGARVLLEDLAKHEDAIIRFAAEDRLSRKLPLARDVLDARSEEILQGLEARLALEERYGEGPGSTASRPVVTWTLAAANALYFLVEVLAGGSEDPRTLFRLGAAISQWDDPSQAWRLLASTFLHWGPLHLTMNMLGLLAIGPYLERALGRSRYLAVYLGSGILSALVVVLTSEEGTFLVGASGCIMGLIGGTAAVLLRGWRKKRSRALSRRLAGILLILALQVAFDLSTPEVSFSAHLTGMVVGFLATATMKHWPATTRPAPG